MNGFCDAHCHLDFYQHASRVTEQLLKAGCTLLNASITPDKTLSMSAVAAALNPDSDNQSSGKLLVGLGLHPWCINAGEVSQEQQIRFFELIDHYGILGEVGLDFSPHYQPHAAEQISFFEKMCRCLMKSSDHASTAQKTLSIHAVKSTNTVLELLNSYSICTSHRVIFHWFSGSHTELLKAQRLGCLFSVNKRMLESKRGRAYVAEIPTSSLLIETDAPSRAWDTSDPTSAYEAHKKQLIDTYELLAQLKGETVEALAEKLSLLV